MFISTDVAYFTIISTRKHKEDLLKAISAHGGRFMDIKYGKGTVKATSLVSAVGFVPENEKLIITFFIAKSHSDDIIKMLTNEFHFDQPNTGIAFSQIVKSFAV